MKIRKTILLLVVIFSIMGTSCGIFNSNKKCDCPKFGQEIDNNASDTDDAATASTLDSL